VGISIFFSVCPPTKKDAHTLDFDVTLTRDAFAVDIQGPLRYTMSVKKYNYFSILSFMIVPTASPPEQDTLPSGITDSIVAFLRAINTSRLYASGHDLFKKHTQQLHTRLREVMAGRDSLFLGCARDAIFHEGTFYPPRDANLQKFLKFFHSLRISHVLLYKEITTEELESFIGLLAGAQQGQGDEVSSALMRENIRHARVGIMDYTIFSTAQTVAAQLSQTGQEEAIWRQLILQPAGTGAFNVSPVQTERLALLSEDVEELKKLLLQMDADILKAQGGTPVAHRGLLLADFIQNLGDMLSGIAPTKRKLLARNIGSVLDSFEPQLKIGILGSVPPSDLREESDVFHEILQAMPDRQLACLVYDAMKGAGPKSACFGNLFNRALARYEEPGVLLKLTRQEMQRAAQQGESDTLAYWQPLEELLIREQEMEEFNEQYRKEIEDLTTSISLNVPMVEEEEMARLLKTIAPESLRPAKAQLIIDLISRLHATRAEAFVASLLESLGEILRGLLSQGSFLTASNLLRDVPLALRDYPEDGLVRETMNSLLNAEDIRALLRDLLKRCRAYEARETAAMDGICQLYPEKAGDFLLDVLIELGDDDSPQARWVSTTLIGLGPSLSRILNRRLPGTPDHAIPRLLNLATMSRDSNLAPAVGQLLEHRNIEVRVRAASALGTLKAEGLVPRLAEIVLQRSWVRTKKMKSLQMAAAHALAEIGTDRARGVLQQVISKGSADLRAFCRELV
jgi:hypothetical protein